MKTLSLDQAAGLIVVFDELATDPNGLIVVFDELAPVAALVTCSREDKGQK